MEGAATNTIARSNMPREFLHTIATAARSGLIALAIASSASLAKAQPAIPLGITEEELFGTQLTSLKWSTWKSQIQVCWENPTQSDEVHRSLVRRAVNETWERYSAVKFIGWAKCNSDSPGVRIRISDESPHTKAIGKFLNKYPAGVVLNFRFENWGRDCATRREFCAYAIAVHEFGHVLGFTHEQNRDDKPPECRQEKAGTNGNYKVTLYDFGSIMNYCNPNWNGDGKLSELNIKGLQWVYGPP
jgi:hypothetical protein